MYYNSFILLYFFLHDITDTDIDWVDLADDIRHEYFVVDNLRPSHGYKFRVLARNKFGWSIPSIPSPIVMTPSTGASKAEFYDALQALQVWKKIYIIPQYRSLASHFLKVCPENSIWGYSFVECD